MRPTAFIGAIAGGQPRGARRVMRGVRHVERRLGALELVTFGGRPADGARRRIARVILEEDGDDCRDFKRIAMWAESIAAYLTAIPKRGGTGPVGPQTGPPGPSLAPIG